MHDQHIIPVGRYTGEVIHAGLGVSKIKGVGYLKLGFKILDALPFETYDTLFIYVAPQYQFPQYLERWEIPALPTEEDAAKMIGRRYVVAVRHEFHMGELWATGRLVELLK